MKKELIEKYGDSLLNIYSQDQLHNCPYQYVLTFKEHEDMVIDNVLFTSYQSFFEKNYLKLPIDPIRKPNKLLTYQEGLDILKRIRYGTLAITHDIPYAFGFTHFVVDGRIYFHTGYKGFKLNGLDKMACYHVIEDLGINGKMATQNYQSVCIYGILQEVKENKAMLIDALLEDLTPDHQKKLTPQSIENTLILELTIDHMDIKRHFY